MANRNVRWLTLTALALANLVCWAGGAAAIALIASPGLDLGLEARLREGQATAVAVWERLERQPSGPAVEPEQAGAIPTPAMTGTTGDQPIAAVITPQNLPPPSTPQPATTAVTEPTPLPGPTLVSHPLLLADPEISDLAPLDAEMARSAPDRAVQIRYQEDTLNAELAALWRNNPDLPYRNVWVNLMRDQVVITGRVSIMGFEVHAEVTGKVAARDCVPVLQIEELNIAGVMTPRFVKDQVEQMILEAMTWYPADYPLCLEQIVLEETRVTAYGYRR